MAKVEQFVCDECGTVKQQTNHWLQSSVVPDTNMLIFSPFAPNAKGVTHICGHACAQKVLERWMAEQRS